MKWEFLVGAVVGVIALFCFLTWVIVIDGLSMESKCLNAGRVVINGSVYECHRLWAEIKP